MSRTRPPRRRATGAERVVERRRENVEILLGFMAFFAVPLLVSTVAAELRGEDALARALALAILVGLGAVLLHVRRVLQRQQDVLARQADAGGAP